MAAGTDSPSSPAATAELRVVQVVHSGMPGGSNEVLVSLLRHRPASVHCHCVFLEDGPTRERVAALGISTELIGAGRARQLWRAPGVVRALRRTIRAQRADVVMAHVSKAHLYAWHAARSERVPYLWRQPERRSQKPLMHELAGRLRSDAVICSAAWTAAEQRARWPKTPVYHVPPGRETDGLGPPRVHTAGADEAIDIGVVGRLQRWKRVELALRALPGTLAVEPRLRLAIMGAAWPGLDEDYPAWLEEEAERLGIAAAVDFRGHVQGAADAIAELDILIHTADEEPFGLVLVEALMRGVPVIAPAAGGPREIVRDGIDGVLVDVERADLLGTAIVQLARDPARRNAMGAAGRQRALEHFSAERMAGDLWTVVQDVASKSARASA